MKKILTMLIVLLLFAGSASAQSNDWQMNFFEDYDNNDFQWPLGTEMQGSTTITRLITKSDYVWNISTSDPNVSWLALNIGFPEASRYRYSAEVRLPDFDPLTCAGLLLDSRGDSMYGYVICNDKTYSLIHANGGNVETLIPYTPINDFDNFSAFTMSAELSDGWVDLYYNGTSLDTYNIDFGGGSFGLIAMPQSTEATDIAFGALSFESSTAAAETTFEASAVDPNASENIARMVKMLNMKERITSSAGTYLTLPDREISLAMMGHSTREGFGVDQQNLLLQSDISWASGYERPDYASSGCGFYLRGLDEVTRVEVFAAMDGVVYVNAYCGGAFVPLIALKYGSWSISGEGRLTVAADEQKITVLWNDAILGTVTDATWRWSGDAGYLVHSGTNGDFGTRCVFRNGEGYLFSGK